jgi:diguanylate cyclase (GGDEF)-like protein/PAS domain S-box-containing protein
MTQGREPRSAGAAPGRCDPAGDEPGAPEAVDEAGGASRTVDAVLASLLTRHPRATVVAINEDAVVVAMPPGVPVAPSHRLVEEGSTLDIVVQQDRSVIVNLYVQARTAGLATGTVRLAGEPDHPVTAHFVDCRSIHGAVVGVISEQLDDVRDLLAQWTSPHLPPRLARAVKDESAVYVSVDEAFSQILGWGRDELVGQRALQIVHPDDHDLAVANWVDMLEHPGPGRRVRLRHQHKDGHWVWLEIMNDNRLDDPDEPVVVAEMVDISEEMATHEALRASEQLLRELAQTIPIGLVHSDPSGRVLFANDRLGEILGVDRLETVDDLVAAVSPDDADAVALAVSSTVGTHTGADLELSVPQAVGSVRHCTLRLRPLVNDDGDVTGIIGCVEDVTDSVRMRRKLEVQATFDPLTECYNRASSLTALQSLLHQIGGHGPTGVAIAYVDLDEFKPVNDTYGHATGDDLLVLAAERIRQSVRSSDIVGRIGGDEFLVICSKVGYPGDAVRIGDAIATHLCQPATIGELELDVRASVGVAWTDDPDIDPEHLVAAADEAMYRSKHDRRCEPALAEPILVGGPEA